MGDSIRCHHVYQYGPMSAISQRIFAENSTPPGMAANPLYRRSSEDDVRRFLARSFRLANNRACIGN